ncbi:hypothetical protein B0H16DRAFT_1476344 [Mycena metata]|uniref:Uncharacterized protein n=1 Tax=Mycena metata TaxID=1033252 RepID=A0AAD7HBJ2_9AGAR|nr:hypothetical protein B0H16DRAFT_1476344 [Mycena metata]
MNVHPMSRRHRLDRDQLSGIDIESLKVGPTSSDWIHTDLSCQTILKITHQVERMDGKWKIRSDIEAAKEKIVADNISVNWVVIGTPLGQDLHDDYILDTTDSHKRELDQFLCKLFAKQIISIPEIFRPKTDNTPDNLPASPLASVGGDQTTVLAAQDSDNRAEDKKDDGVDVDLPIYKIFIVVSDEHQLPVDNRGVTLFLSGVRQDGNHYMVKTSELLQKLQNSPDPVVGSARLAVAITHGGFTFRSTFFTIHEGGDHTGLPANPEIHITPTDAADTTGCNYSLVIFLEAIEKALPAQGKRHYSTLSTDNEEEKKHRASRTHSVDRSVSPSGGAKFSVVQKEATQIVWLEEVSGYNNAIAKSIRQNVSTRQAQPSCAISIWCPYVYIVSHITSGKHPVAR